MARNYEILGDMSFDVNKYKIAGAYYDSTMTKMVENSKPYRIIKRKRENLEDVIYYEGVAEVNDSIIRLVKMNDNARYQFFENYVERLKIEKETEANRLAIEEQKKELAQNNVGQKQSRTFKPKGGIPTTASNFYFYNDQTVAYGKNEFQRIWGQRENTDNWRWSSSSRATQIVTSSNAITQDNEDNQLLDVDYYIAQIPSDEKAIDSISKERNFAYYQLGLIYKEKFKEYDLAKSKFTDLLIIIQKNA